MCILEWYNLQIKIIACTPLFLSSFSKRPAPNSRSTTIPRRSISPLGQPRPLPHRLTFPSFSLFDRPLIVVPCPGSLFADATNDDRSGNNDDANDPKWYFQPKPSVSRTANQQIPCHCGRTFSQRKYLTFHLRWECGRTLICPMCQHPFNSKSYLNSHMKKCGRLQQ